MSYKTSTAKRAIRRRQKQARAANAQMDEFFRKRQAWRTRPQAAASAASEEQRTAAGEAKSKAEASQA